MPQECGPRQLHDDIELLVLDQLFTKTNSGGTDHVWFYDVQAVSRPRWPATMRRVPIDQ